MRMWEHLWPDVEQVAGNELAGKIKARSLRMKSGAGVGVVTQSQRAVRGLRVQKLRCDEVEMFDEGVWEAAQMVVKSREAEEGATRGGGVKAKANIEHRTLNIEHRTAVTEPIIGSIEAISTYHRAGGLMERIIERANERGTPVIRWCLMEVLEKCAAERECVSCALFEECGGAAKERCEGFVSIDDALAIKGRVSREAWDSEMLCRRPSARGSVFPNFQEGVHVGEAVGGRQYAVGRGELWLGVDFGFANPFVCLWIVEEGRVSFVIDEHVMEGVVVEEHLKEIESRGWGKVHRVACDPAGAGRNEQTAMSNVQLLRRRGYVVRYRKSLIVEGLEMIRAALRPAAGEPTLFVHPRCKRLIAALKGYRYAEGGGEVPLKDGVHDHLIDALRYYFVNRQRGELIVRRY